MPSISLDFESLENTLQVFMGAHDTLSTTTQTMNSTLAGTQWQSPAAEDFRNSWNSTYQPNLLKIIAAIETFNGDVRNQLARYKSNEGIG